MTATGIHAWWLVFVVTLLLAGLGYGVARCFSRRTLRWVTLAVGVAVAGGMVIWATGTVNPPPVASAVTDEFQGVAAWFWSSLYRVGVAPRSTSGWVVFVGVLVVGYLVLEGVAARREPPQVTVADPETDDNDETKQLIAELKVRLPAVQVTQPSPTPPGGSGPSPTSGEKVGQAVAAVAETTPSRFGPLLGALVRLVLVLVPPLPSYVVRLRAEKPVPGDDRVQVTVTVYGCGSARGGPSRRCRRCRSARRPKGQLASSQTGCSPGMCPYRSGPQGRPSTGRT